MKNLMLLMSLVILVSCNGKDSDNIRRTLEQDDEYSEITYTGEEMDSLNCNEDLLKWVGNVPRSLEAAKKILTAKPQYEECGHFDLYIYEVILENPKATYLKELIENEEGEDISDTQNDLTEEQALAMICNEEYLGFALYPPQSLQQAKNRMIQNSEYKKCGLFDLYIDEVISTNPYNEFLKELLK